jgi:hypothetical protein
MPLLGRERAEHSPRRATDDSGQTR